MKVNNKRKIADEDASRDPRSVDTPSHAKRRNLTHITGCPAHIDEVMCNGHLRWFGHVQRRYVSNVTRRVVDLTVPGTRRRGRPTQHINEDMMGVGVT